MASKWVISINRIYEGYNPLANHLLKFQVDIQVYIQGYREVKVWLDRKNIPRKTLFTSGGTPPKFNIAPEKLPSQKVSSLPTIHFQGLC